MLSLSEGVAGNNPVFVRAVFRGSYRDVIKRGLTAQALFLSGHLWERVGNDLTKD
jgi:hypothetical protein